MQKSAQKTLASQNEGEKGGYQRLVKIGGVRWDKSCSDSVPVKCEALVLGFRVQ